MEVIQAIVKPELQGHYRDWLDHANQREKRGLRLIAQILEVKGRKKIKNETTSSMIQKLSLKKAISVGQAEEILRKNEVTTTYHRTFGYLESELKPQNNIFKYKKLKELDFAIPLTPLSVQMISNWIELNDELEFQEDVLCTLRAIYSRYKAQEIALTEMRQQYTWNIDWDLAKPLRFDKAGSELRAYKPNYQAILKQRVRQEKLMQKLKELQNSEYAQKLKLFKHFKIT